MAIARLGSKKALKLSREISPRELQILSKLMEGYAYADIGDYFGICYETVKCHVTSMCNKTGMDDSRALIAHMYMKEIKIKNERIKSLEVALLNAMH